MAGGSPGDRCGGHVPDQGPGADGQTYGGTYIHHLKQSKPPPQSHSSTINRPINGTNVVGRGDCSKRRVAVVAAQRACSAGGTRRTRTYARRPWAPSAQHKRLLCVWITERVHGKRPHGSAVATWLQHPGGAARSRILYTSTAVVPPRHSPTQATLQASFGLTAHSLCTHTHGT